MKTIYKYQLETDDAFVLEMPNNSKILSVQTQGNTPCMWVEVDTEEVKVKRVFEIYGTGHRMKPISEHSHREYIGTYQLMGGTLVFHLYEIIMPF